MKNWIEQGLDEVNSGVQRDRMDFGVMLSTGSEEQLAYKMLI